MPHRDQLSGVGVLPDPVQDDAPAINHDLLHRLAMLGTIHASVAHELNNLLTPVLAYVQLAEREPDNPDLRQKVFEHVALGVQSAVEILQSTLDFTKGRSEEATCNVRAVVDRALTCLARDPAKDRIEVRIDVPDDVHAAIDAIALQQVFLNLMINACRAMQGRGGRLTIKITRITKQDIVIICADTGPGIPVTQSARLFRPFERDEAATSPSASSSHGLGLSICQTLLGQFSGEIWLANPGGPGAEFRIRLPRAQAAGQGVMLRKAS
jgi:signal transduction histidine kinase